MSDEKYYVGDNLLSSPMNALVKPLTFLLGLVFVVIGIAGFFTGSPLLVFQVDTIHNVIHLFSGLMALYSLNSGYNLARSYLMVFGLIYALFAVVGVVQGDTVFGLFGVNTADHWLNGGIALCSLLVGFGSKRA